MAGFKWQSDTTRGTAAWLAGASVAFWLSWLVAPGVGVLDAARGGLLLAGHRVSIPESLRIISALGYAFGLTALLRFDHGERGASVRIGSSFVFIGAIGIGVSPFVHLVAPEVFFAIFCGGHALLVPGLRNESWLGQVGFCGLALVPAIVLLGWIATRFGFIPRPVVGLTILGAVTGSLSLVSLSMTSRGRSS